MTIRVGCISMLCVGSLLVPMAHANKIQNSAEISADSVRSKTVIFGVINQDIMNIVGRVAYDQTPGQVIDELVSTYGNGQASSTSLASITALLSQQLSYVNLVIESAQAVIAMLPPTSPHIVAAKLIINELSVSATCVQTILSQLQQNAQMAAPAAAATASSTTAASPTTPAATAAAPAASTASTASNSNVAFASEAITLLGDIASAVAASSTAPSTTAVTTASTTTTAASSETTIPSSLTAAASDSNTHHHGSHTLGW